MPEYTLEFIGRQLENVQREIAEFRDVLVIQTAILRRMEARLDALDIRVDTMATEMRALASRIDRVGNRVRAIEDARP